MDITLSNSLLLIRGCEILRIFFSWYAKLEVKELLARVPARIYIPVLHHSIYCGVGHRFS